MGGEARVEGGRREGQREGGREGGKAGRREGRDVPSESLILLKAEALGI